MNTYAQNLEIVNQFVTRNREKILEIPDKNVWVNDIEQEMKISKERQEGWLTVENTSGNSISFFPVDGNGGVFQKNGLDVKDIRRFEYFDSPRATQRKTAGPCDCLLLNERWRFFEFKNSPITGTGVVAASINRDKAEKQLARTITYFREKAIAKGIGKVHAIFEGVVVTKPNFPRFTGSVADRGEEFFLEFQARLIEITTDEVYIITSTAPQVSAFPTITSPAIRTTPAKCRVRRKVVQRRVVKSRRQR